MYPTAYWEKATKQLFKCHGELTERRKHIHNQNGSIVKDLSAGVASGSIKACVFWGRKTFSVLIY